MGKTKINKPEYRSTAKYLMISPTKLRRVADVVRNKPYPEAIAMLEVLPQKGADMLLKVVKSAGSNALYKNKMLDEDSLYVKEVQINEGPRLKRVWPRGKGRRDILLKRMSHAYVVVDEKAQAGE
ncbi:MAG: 50S ribosomal protein L22 [Spirochaetales bacterium]|nr:50S ribosomal protein L22 [Spirochaetales bacterium]